MILPWQEKLLELSARIEAAIDFSDEGEVGEDMPARWTEDVADLAHAMAEVLARPPAERLKDGIRVAIAGPPNAGKSSLLNWLAGRQAAITSAIAGTTRDLVEAPTSISGTPFVLVDTAGLRESEDEVEAIGVRLAEEALQSADLILWLGDPTDAPDPARTLVVASKSDLRGGTTPGAEIEVSAETGDGMGQLIGLLIDRGRGLLPQEGAVALNDRHRRALGMAQKQLFEAEQTRDHVIAAECLRQAREALDQVTGRAGVENMLDGLFGRFCIGK